MKIELTKHQILGIVSKLLDKISDSEVVLPVSRYEIERVLKYMQENNKDTAKLSISSTGIGQSIFIVEEDGSALNITNYEAW